MKRGVILLILMILTTSILSANAFAVQIEKKVVNNIVIKELNIAARFNITIKNDLPYMDDFSIDSFLAGMNIYPKTIYRINASAEQSIDASVFLSDNIKDKYHGSHNLEFYVKGEKSGIVKDTLPFKILRAEEVINTTMPSEIGMDDGSIEIEIGNSADSALDINIKVVSELFSHEEKISIDAFSSKKITISLDKEKMKKAGDYVVGLFLKMDSYEMQKTHMIKLLPREKLETEEKSKISLFYYSSIIRKINKGNVPVVANIAINKSAFANAFTSFNLLPSTKREKNVYMHEWQSELKPDETLEVEVRTSFLPALAILFAIAIASAIYGIATKKKVVLKKKAIRAETKTGHSAMKIVLAIKNRSEEEIEDVAITDIMPPLAKLHERYGTVKPDRIEKNKLIWEIGNLAKGEERVFSYVIYSDVKILGRVELPAAVATYKSKGIFKREESNRIFVLQ